MRLIFPLFITLFLSNCSRKTIIKADNWNVSCECVNSGTSTYESTKKYLLSIGEDPELTGIDKDWDYLNESELGNYSSSEYRLTVHPSFENGYSIRIVNLGTLTTVLVRLPDKQYVQVNQLNYDNTKWEDVTSGMDSLFWNQNFKSNSGYAIHDGTSYTFEGLANGEYKLIIRGTIGVKENQLLLNRFQSFLHEIPYENCKKKINCL